MNKVLVFVLSVAMSLVANAARYRYVTFNIWGDYFGNPPEERDVQEAALLKKLNPDFIALQEMTANFWKSRLIGNLSDKFEALGREDGAKGGDSYTPLLFKKDKFTLLEKGAVLFHPELDVSKSVVWAAVKDKETGEKIVTFSTHFWWRKDGVADDYVRLENARRLYGVISEVANRHSAAIVGGGDLNSSPISSAFAELNRLGWRSAQETSPGKDTRPSWHGFPVRGDDGKYHGIPLDKVENATRLDYIFYDPSRARPYEFRVVDRGGVEDISDHYPLVFDFVVHEKREWKDPRKATAFIPRKPSEGARAIVSSQSDAVGFVTGAPEVALWRIEHGEINGLAAKTLEIALDVDDERVPVAAICGVRLVVDAVRERLPDAVLKLHPMERYASRDVVNREIRLLADGKRVVWCGAKVAPQKSQLPRTCVPKARLDVVGSRGKWWWLNRLEEKQNEIAAGKGEYDVVMLGDSITHFWENTAYWSCGRDVYEGMCEKYALLNLGYGGDRTESVLWRCQNGELDGYKAKIVQIMIGTNNGGDTPEDTALGIKKIIEIVKIKQPQAKILLLPVFPRGKPGDAHRTRVGRINAIIKGFADGKSIVWYDFTDRFLNSKGEFLPKLMINDLLHPHHAGYELWRDAVMPKYDEMLAAANE